MIQPQAVMKVYNYWYKYLKYDFGGAGKYGESFLETMGEFVFAAAASDAASYDDEINLTCTACQVVNNNIQTLNGKGAD